MREYSNVAAMTYLHKDSRTGIYHHRRAVPPALRAVVGKREIKRSLGTKEAEYLYESHIFKEMASDSCRIGPVIEVFRDDLSSASTRSYRIETNLDEHPIYVEIAFAEIAGCKKHKSTA
jgi:hypothetical protein